MRLDEARQFRKVRRRPLALGVLAQQRQAQHEADREIVDQIGGIVARPVVVLGARAPADEAGPAVQPRQLAGEVVHPVVFGHAELVHDVGDDALRRVVGGEDALDVQAADEQPQIAPRHRTPGGEQALFAPRHLPHRLALVEEVETALDHQFVERRADLGAEQHVDDGVERPARRHVGADLRRQRRAADLARRQRQAGQHGMDVGRVGECGRRADRRLDSGQQHHQQALQIESRDVPLPDQEARHLARQHGAVDLARGQMALLECARQIAARTEQALARRHGLVERQVLQPVERVVVDEGAHRPEVGDRLPGDVDDGADLETPPERKVHRPPPVRVRPAIAKAPSTPV